LTLSPPWPDYRLLASIEEKVKDMDAIPHRRFIKFHIPLDGLPYNENVKYIQVTREMHDAFFSLQNHWNILTDQNLATKDKYGDKPFRSGTIYHQFGKMPESQKIDFQHQSAIFCGREPRNVAQTVISARNRVNRCLDGGWI
jgi:hypothetical protein